MLVFVLLKKKHFINAFILIKFISYVILYEIIIYEKKNIVVLYINLCNFNLKHSFFHSYFILIFNQRKQFQLCMCHHVEYYYY